MYKKNTKLDNNTYNFEYVFDNLSNYDLEKSCFKMVFDDGENHIFCIKYLKSGEEIINSFNFDKDFYLKYDDYSIVKMTDKDTKKYYDAYLKI